MDTNFIHNNIINKTQECDIFIHSFDLINKANILKKYPNVKQYLIEEQIDFKKSLSDENKIFEKSLNQEIFPSPISLFSSLSFMYSRKKAIELALKNNKKYDVIICCRFDNTIRLKYSAKNCNPTKLIIPKLNEIDTKYIYMSWWEHLHSGYSDHWFFSNSKNMKILADMYDILHKSLVINSDFDIYSKKLGLKYNSQGFRANNHTIHKFYLDKIGFGENWIKFLKFYGN